MVDDRVIILILFSNYNCYLSQISILHHQQELSVRFALIVMTLMPLKAHISHQA